MACSQGSVNKLRYTSALARVSHLELLVTVTQGCIHTMACSQGGFILLFDCIHTMACSQGSFTLMSDCIHTMACSQGGFALVSDCIHTMACSQGRFTLLSDCTHTMACSQGTLTLLSDSHLCISQGAHLKLSASFSRAAYLPWLAFTWSVLSKTLHPT